MKQIIHIDIPNPEDKVECYEKIGGFFSAVGALYAIWRYGKGRIVIGDDEEDEKSLVS